MSHPKTTFVVILSIALISAGATAQATRTWISGVGDDVNPCSRTAPCKTFAGAISKTAAGGEIDVLDPNGAGAVTITKSIVIDGGGSTFGAILASGANGININAAPTDNITIRNITINGSGTTLGNNGINVLAVGALHLENVAINRFNSGISVASSGSGTTQVTLDRVVVRDTVNVGIATTGTAAAPVKLTVRDSSFLGTTAGPGMAIGGFTTALVRNAVSAGNSGAGFSVNASTGTAQFTLVDSSASSNSGPGLQVVGTGSTSAIARISGNTLFFNVGGIAIGAGGFVATYGDNEITGGITGGTLTSLTKQ